MAVCRRARSPLLALIAALLLVAAAVAEDPYLAADESWISLEGTVAEVAEESFRLDYGEGLVTVEMEGWDWYEDARETLVGDRVTVSGRVDDAFLERRTIEAGSVFVKGLSRYFYADPGDEEGALVTYPVHYPVDPLTGEASWLTVTGTVRSVDGRQFTLGKDSARLTVDTIAMPYNPMDNTGEQQIDVGDRVSVSGSLDLAFFEDAHLLATAIVTLDRDR
jgi:uncharacterized protein YdeI (BOF family)